MRILPITLPQEKLAAFCAKNGIRRLSLFGSVLRDDFTAESDVDILVEFLPGRTPGFMGMVRMENELTSMIGRKVDFRTPGELSPYMVDRVLGEAFEIYHS